MADVAFLGLGAIGFPMAGHLAAAGHRVTVYNRTSSKADAWVADHGGRAAATPAEAAAHCEFVFSCVGNDDDVREVLLGRDGASTGITPGAVVVDHTTGSAGLARELAGRFASQRAGFVDAPVSGGQAGAENGRLTIMCGCDDSAVFGRIEPIVAAYSRSCVRLGPSGSGQLTKMVNQIALVGVVQGLAEALNFCVRAGLDPDAVVDVLRHGAAQSWHMEHSSTTMTRGEFDFGFAVQWVRKDLGIALAEAHGNGARLPVTALLDQFFAQIEGRGGIRWDVTSLIDLLQRDLDGSNDTRREGRP